MKFLFDLFPVFLFFGVYKVADMHQQASYALVQGHLTGLISGGSIAADQGAVIIATLVAIIASVLQIAYVLLRRRKVDLMLWISFGVIVVFGSATIYLHNETFIKWKPTILNWIYGGAMLFAQVLLKKNLIREMMSEALTLPDQVWNRLGFAWIGFFFVVGLVNLLVAFVFFQGNTSAWVTFKAFGMTGISLLFIILQTVYLSRYVKEESA